MLYIPNPNPYAVAECYDDSMILPALHYAADQALHVAQVAVPRKRPFVPDSITTWLQGRDSARGWWLHYIIALRQQAFRRFRYDQADHPVNRGAQVFREWDAHFCEFDHDLYPRLLTGHHVDLEMVPDTFIAYRMLLDARWCGMKEEPRWTGGNHVPYWAKFRVLRAAIASENDAAGDAQQEGKVYYGLFKDHLTGLHWPIRSDILPACSQIFSSGLLFSDRSEFEATSPEGRAELAAKLGCKPSDLWETIVNLAVAWPILRRSTLKGTIIVAKKQHPAAPETTAVHEPAPEPTSTQFDMSSDEAAARREAAENGEPFVMSPEEAAAREASGNPAPEGSKVVPDAEERKRILAEQKAARQKERAEAKEQREKERAEAKAAREKERAEAKAACEAAKVKAAPKEPGGSNVGREAQIYTTHGGKNPRREQSHGWHSYNIVLGKEGITVGEFLEKGGRRTDLSWDLEHGNYRVVLPDGSEIYNPKPAAPEAPAANDQAEEQASA